MKILKLLFQIVLLYLIFMCGKWIQVKLNLFIPGSILGMILLFGLLMANIVRTEWIEAGSNMLVRNLPLLFLPVTVGIINYLELFAGKGLLLVLIILISTLLVMVGSGFVTHWVWQRSLQKNE